MDAVRPYHPDPLIGSFTGTKNSTGLPNLHRAVRADCLWSIGNLLDKGADINEKDRDGLTPLHAATRYVGRAGRDRGIQGLVKYTCTACNMHGF